MGELARLLYLVVVILPLALLFIGPLLMLAALRGMQRVGPIILDPGRRGARGRVGALLLGLSLWLVVWGGVAAVLSQVRLSAISSSSPSAVRAVATPTRSPAVPTPTSLPAASPQPSVTPTPTYPPTAEVHTPFPSPTASPIPPTPTPALPTATATPIPPTPVPLPAATFTPSVVPIATLSPEQAIQAIAAVEAANALLRDAVIEPSIGNLAALETLWRGDALAKAQAFAQDLYQEYLRPLEVRFIYALPPVAIEGNSPDTAIVISSEAWTYTGPRAAHRESFEFTYSLTRQEEGWVITDYDYHYAPSNLPTGEGEIVTTIPTTLTVTATTGITSGSQ